MTSYISSSTTSWAV